MMVFLSDKMALPAYVAMLRYTSSFRDKDGYINTIHILFRGDSPRKEVRMGSTPVVLERESPRLGGLAPTTARVSLYADTDGDFRELYSHPEGAVKLLIYTGGTLAYIGTLDPEFYEEDYTKRAGYMVDLVFSDFGVAKRLQHKYTGNKKLKEWVDIFVRDAILPARYGFSGDIIPTSSTFFVKRFLEVGNSDDIFEDTAPTIDIEDRAVISARAFYKEDSESLSIYESLDGLLASFALTLSLDGNKALVTDRHYLLSRTPITAQISGDDSVFSADESYTALNIDIEPRNDLQVVNYTHPTINDGEVRTYPRLDRPDISAYSARLKPIPGCLGSYNVSTTPHTVGDDENFIAFCFCPVKFQLAVISVGDPETTKGGTLNATVSFVEETYKKIGTTRPGESSEATYRYLGPVTHNMQLVYRPAHLGIQKWQQIPEVYPTDMFSPRLPASQRGVIAKLTIPVISSGDSYVKVNAQLYVSSQPSLYQACDKNYCLDTHIDYGGRGVGYLPGDAESVQHRFESETFERMGIILIGARLRAGKYILQGKRVAYEERYAGKVIYKPKDVYTYEYAWVEYSEQTKDAHVYLPFGDNQSYAFRSWVDINSELVQVPIKEVSREGDFVYREYAKTQGLHGEGLTIPPPPSDVDSVTIEVLQEVLFGHYLLEQWATALGVSTDPKKRIEHYYNKLASTEKIAHFELFALETNVLAPAYVLMRGLSLSMVDARPGKNQTNSRITKTAKLNASGYEVLNIEPLVSNDPSLPRHSPSLIRDAHKAGVFPPIARYMSGSLFLDLEILSTWGNTTELLASEAFAMHGTRRSCLEGTFRTPPRYLRYGAPTPHLSYHGKRYMVLSERRDLRKCQMFCRLVEVSDIDYTPTLTFGETSESANTIYMIE